MRYIALDCETTGLNPREDQVLEIGMVASWGPKLRILVQHDRVAGDPVALKMNAELISIIAAGEHLDLVRPQHIHYAVSAWLLSIGFSPKGRPIVVAGKNVGFDYGFLSRILYFQLVGTSLRLDDGFVLGRRVLDPAILYVNPAVDENIPSMEDCCDRAGIKHNDHTAIGDCECVIELLRLKGF